MTNVNTQGGELVFEGRVALACPIERAALRDSRLSWAARGLFAFLWDLPENWSPRVNHLANMGTDGVHATRSALAELESVGALRIEKLRGDGGMLAGQRWVVVSATRWAVESPLLKSESGGSDGATKKTVQPECDFPSLGKSETRFSRVSGNRMLRVSKYKVPQVQGSPNTTTTTHARADALESVVVVDEKDEKDKAKANLFWPTGLTEGQLGIMRAELFGNGWPGQEAAQALLDEVAGVMGQGKAKNPPGLLRKLLERHQQGTFSFELGVGVREAREGKQKQQEREAASAAGRTSQQPVQQTTAGSGNSPVAMLEREKLRRERNDRARSSGRAISLGVADCGHGHA